MQRFGGALNLNVHFHVLLPDAVFVPGQDDTFKIVPLPPPRDSDVLHLAQKLARRVTTLYAHARPVRASGVTMPLISRQRPWLQELDQPP